MRDFQGKREFKRILYSWPVLVLLGLMVLLAARSVWVVWQKARVVVADRDNLAKQVADLQARQDQLAKDLSSLQTPRGVEQAIREKFSVVKAGEGVVTVVEPTTTPAPTSTPSWWQVLLNMFEK